MVRVAKHFRQFPAISKIHTTTLTSILTNKTAKNFLEPEWSGPCRETLFGGQIMEPLLYCPKICWPHVLCSVHSETSDAHINHSIEKLNLLLANVFLTLVQVSQPNKITVSALVWVIIVINKAIVCSAFCFV